MSDFEKQHDSMVDDSVELNFQKLSNKIDNMFEQRQRDMKNLHQTVIDESEKSS